MWTTRDVTLRLRRELDHERLVVKFLPNARPGTPLPGRFAICERVHRLTGARRWPVTMLDDGRVYHGGSTTFREVALEDELVCLHETLDEEFLSLEPTLMRRVLERRDNHHHDFKAELQASLARKRAEKERIANDDVVERSKYYRKAFARVMRGEDPGV